MKIAIGLAAVVLAGAAEVRLPEAAKAMDRAALRAALANKANVNAAMVDGTTALHWAAHNEDAESVELLLRAGANAKAANRYGVMPLHLAASAGSAAVVKALLAAGADANSALPGGETPLMIAARNGRGAVVKVLIAAGAKVEAKEDTFGQTALMWAAAEGNVEAIEALLAAGADLHARSKNGFTAFLFAAREGRVGSAKALLRAGADRNETIQSSAARLGGVNGPPANGATALLLATINGHYEFGAYLLEMGADPNAAAPGLTPLHAITHTRKPGVGDNDPPPDGSGNMTSLEFVKVLVRHGAKVNARMTKKINLGLTSLNTMGATPYFLAAKTADADLMRLLVELGADPKIPNENNSTPLMAIAGLGTRSPGEDAGTEPEVLEALQVALDHGADINAVDHNGETAMHGAAYKNSPKAVQFLYDKGAKIEIWNRKNKFGWTPLYIAEGYRFGNFKPSPDTIEVFRKIMTAAGASIAIEPGVKGR